MNVRGSKGNKTDGLAPSFELTEYELHMLEKAKCRPDVARKLGVHKNSPILDRLHRGDRKKGPDPLERLSVDPTALDSALKKIQLSDPSPFDPPKFDQDDRKEREHKKRKKFEKEEELRKKKTGRGFIFE